MEDLESWERVSTFDGQPLHVQFALILSGSLFLLGVGFAVMPSEVFVYLALLLSWLSARVVYLG